MKQSASATHQKNLATGLTVISEIHAGEGDAAVSVVRYSDGSTWHFDNGNASRLSTLYGFREANRGQEPAWFLTLELARAFDRGCGEIFGEPEVVSADDVELSDILLDFGPEA